MKKTITLLLVLALALSLCACGSKNVSGTVTPAEPAAEPETSVEEAPAEPEAELELGTVSGTRYENAYFGIGCEMDDSWVFADQEELAGMIGLTADAIGGDVGESMRSADMFYDLFAQSESEMASVNIVVQNIGVAAGLMTEDQMVSAALPTLAEQLEPAGFSDIQVEEITADFMGGEHHAIHLSAMYQGVQLYERQFYLNRGRYVSTVTITTYHDDRTEDCAALFFAVG